METTIFSQGINKMAWVRAVWMEKGEEMEDVLPSTWVLDKEVITWPKSSNSSKMVKERKKPENSWHKFPLIKIKCSSGKYLQPIFEKIIDK